MLPVGISFRYHCFGEQNGNKRDLAELSKEMHVKCTWKKTICEAWDKKSSYRAVEEPCQVVSQWILASNSHWFLLQPEIKLARCCLLLDVPEEFRTSFAPENKPCSLAKENTFHWSPWMLIQSVQVRTGLWRKVQPFSWRQGELWAGCWRSIQQHFRNSSCKDSGVF